MNKKKNYNSISLIRVVATVFVLTLHTNGCFWEFDATAPYWKSANVIECVFYPAVPLFFMVSGITLMNFMERYSIKEYFVKRINKTFIPFLAWSLIGLMGQIVLHEVDLNELSLKFVYQGITGTTIVESYWFFTSLFIIYLSIPLFAAVDKNKREVVFTYLVIVGFVLNQLLPFLKDVFKSDLNTPYSVTVVSGALLWVPLGWLLYNKKLNVKTKAVIYLLAAFGLFLHIFGTYTLSIEAGEIIRTFKGYQNVPCTLYAVGIFVLVKDLSDLIMKGKVETFVSWLAGYCFPVYLMQFIFLTGFKILPFVNTKSLIYRLCAPYVIFAIIVGITWVMRKIPVVRRIVP